MNIIISLAVAAALAVSVQWLPSLDVDAGMEGDAAAVAGESAARWHEASADVGTDVSGATDVSVNGFVGATLR